MKRLALGVIGLGSRWRQYYRPALHELRDRFVVAQVYDELAQKAIGEAQRLGCKHASSLRDAIQSPGIDALLLPDTQWFGLWPLQLAARLQRPVLLASSLVKVDEAAALETAEREQLPLMLELGICHSPATVRLGELIQGHIGPPRLLVCDSICKAGRSGAHLDPAVLDLCVRLFGGEPTAIRPATPLAGLVDVLMEFAGDRAARLSYWEAPHAKNRVRLEVVAEHGFAEVCFPCSVRWTDRDGTHLHELRSRNPVRLLLEQFHRQVTHGESPSPGVTEARRLLHWLRTAFEAPVETAST